MALCKKKHGETTHERPRLPTWVQGLTGAGAGGLLDGKALQGGQEAAGVEAAGGGAAGVQRWPALRAGGAAGGATTPLPALPFAAAVRREVAVRRLRRRRSPGHLHGCTPAFRV